MKWLFSLLVLVAACGGASGGSADPVEGPAVGTVRFRVRNETADLKWAVVSHVNSVVQELTVSGVDYAPNPYTVTLCGGDGLHDDPSYRSIAVSPGGAVEYVWGATTGGAARFVQDDARRCTRIVREAREQPATASACLFDSDPPNPNSTPSTLAKRCATASFSVPATGERLVEIVVR